MNMDIDMEKLHLEESKGPKELAKKIKQLEYDNLQLRIRIYMNEQQLNGGVCPTTFDVNAKNELVAEYLLMKRAKEEAEQKLRELQSDDEGGDKNIHYSSKPLQAQNRQQQQTIQAMTTSLVDLGHKYNQTETEKKYLLLKLEETENTFRKLLDEKNRQLEQEQLKTESLQLDLENVKMQLEKSFTDVNMLRRECERHIAERQDEAHSRTVSNLVAGNQNLRGRLGSSEEALRLLYEEHIKLASELKTLKANYVAQLNALGQINDLPVDTATQRGERLENNNTRHNLSSPDLGIGLESGQEAQNENNEEADVLSLRRQKNQLVQKLNQTRQDLYKTGARLSTTTKHREQVEKAVCRQLHKTHSILKEARLNMERKQSQQVLKDLNPSNPH